MKRFAPALVLLLLAAIFACVTIPTIGQTITVSPGVAIQQGGVPQGTVTTLNCSTNVTCTNSGPVSTITASGGGSSITLQTNGTNNGSQSLLNLAAGANITLVDNGTGTVTIASTGGGGSGGNGITVYSGAPSVALTGTTFFPIGGGSAAATAESQVQSTIRSAVTVSNFGVDISTALGTGNSAAFTWRKNGSSQTITCTISGASSTSCSDTTHSFTASAGDTLDVQVVFSGVIGVTPVFNMNVQMGAASSGGGGSFVLVEQHTATNSASLNFTTGISSTYDDYQIELLNVVPVSNAVNLIMRMSTDGGATYDSGSNYFWDALSWRAGSGTVNAGGTDTSIGLTAANSLSISNATTMGASFSLNFFQPLSTTLYKQVRGKGMMLFQDGSTRVMLEVGGQYTSTTAVNAFQFLMSSGNISSGTIRLYGLSH
jgi:hypothetical protein